MGNSWNEEEVRATVKAYFELLESQRQRATTNKAAIYRGLSERFPNRTSKSFELKFQNISAILYEQKLEYCDGLKPKSNYQNLLKLVVLDEINRTPLPQVEPHEILFSKLQRLKQKGLIPVDAPIRPIPGKLRKWDALGTDDRDMAIKSMAVYAGMIEAMDFNIGRLIEHLKRTGQYDNTVFIVTSDNGAEGSDPLASRIMRMWLPRSGYNRDLETIGERGSYVFIGPEFANAASAPGAWFKFTSAEGGLRVPLIMTLPGMKSRRVEHGLSYVTDIAATIFDFAASGPPAPGEMTGRSLRPVLDGATHAVYAENDIIGQEAAGHSALFRGDYKITRVNPPHGDRQWRLYELATDPGETHDLATAEPERFQAMLGEYEAWAEANKVIQVPDDYTHVKQMTTNFAEHMMETRPWILAIPAVILLSVLGLMWGLYRLVRG
jgi:hypothetical protein